MTTPAWMLETDKPDTAHAGTRRPPALGESMGTWGPLTRPPGPGGTLVAMRWKCPNPKCPPTDVAPVDVTSQYNEVPTSQCGGECGLAYPTSAFKRVT